MKLLTRRSLMRAAGIAAPAILLRPSIAQFDSCLPGICGRATSPPIVAVTWESGSVTAVTLSNGDLTATSTGTTSADQGAKVASASGKNTGKYYFEARFDTAASGINWGIGIGTYASTYTGMGNTGGVTGVESFRTGSTWTGGASVFSTGAWNTLDIAGLAIDLDNRKYWIRDTPSFGWNAGLGGATPDPATNTNGQTIPAGVMVPFVTFGGSGGAAGRLLTANFGATAFNGAVPSGFIAGWPV